MIHRRRRERQQPTSFPVGLEPSPASAHLAPEDPDELCAPEDAAVPDSEARPDGAPPRRRGRVIAVAAAVGATILAVVIVVVVVVAPTGAVTARTVDPAAATSGVLLPMPDVPTELWSVEAEGGSAWVVEDLLVVHTGDDLVGVDLDSGAEQWRAAMGGPVRCGGDSQWEPVTTSTSRERLTCLRYPPASEGIQDDEDPVEPTHLLVVDGSGAIVVERALDAEQGGGTATDGDAIVRAVRVGEAVPSDQVPAVDSATDEPKGEVPGRDVLLVVEEATGEGRWEVLVPFDESAAPGSCVVSQGPASAGTDRLRVGVENGLVEVGGCGVSAVFSLAGARLDDPLVDASVEVQADGTAVRSWWSDELGGQQAHVDADGRAIGVLPGRVHTPWASVDAEPWLWFVHEDHALLVAHDAAGDRVWASDDLDLWDLLGLHVRAGDTLLYSTQSGLGALDAGTGEQRWWREYEEPREPDGDGGVTGRSIGYAFTDGSRAVLQVSGDLGLGSDPFDQASVIAVDLADGQVVWAAPITDPYSYLHAFEGRLFLWQGEGLTRLG